ncbi:MAG TPA: META domain-containing protein, partial [Candidatus Limnocylindrales bacterium]|nr:META domain-containing protein [Candidatus Limnocylindrales bacterium]
PNAPAGLAGRQFLSTGVARDGAPFTLVAGSRIRLTFDDGQLSANAGCNTIGGNLTIDGNRLVFTGGQMTEMACQEPLMAQDDWLVAFLDSGATFVLNGNDLTLTAGDTVITLFDREVAEPDQPLVGPTWSLTSIISGDAVASVPIGVSAWLVFADDGTFSMNDGCNSGGGRYVVDGATIAFADVVTTKMACAGAAGQVEQAVLAVIGSQSGVAFAIDASSLTFMAGATGLQFSNAPVAQ